MLSYLISNKIRSGREHFTRSYDQATGHKKLFKRSNQSDSTVLAMNSETVQNSLWSNKVLLLTVWDCIFEGMHTSHMFGNAALNGMRYLNAYKQGSLYCMHGIYPHGWTNQNINQVRYHCYMSTWLGPWHICITISKAQCSMRNTRGRYMCGMLLLQINGQSCFAS